MAFLRLPCSPSTLSLSNDHRQAFHRTPLSSSLHKTIGHFNCTLNLKSNNNLVLSWSASHSLSHTHTHTLPAKTNKIGHFVLHFSSITQDPVVDSKTKVDEEEYSRTTLLAQNIPWTCTPEDIRSLFEKFGTVVEVELSMYDKTRNRGLAFVTMGSPEEALTALNGLQSSEFEGRKLKMNYAKPKKIKASLPGPPKPGPTFNLFVANLPFDARAKDLREFLIAEGCDVVSVDVIFHDNPRKSSGYGFVAFKSKKQADEALSNFQGKIFMGRPLRVARSRRFVRQQRKEGLQSDDTSTELDGVEQADTADDSSKGSFAGNEEVS